MTIKGKIIAVYGINGIGKTTQVELLVEFLKSQGINANRLKYPIYNLEPEGPFLNKYLRDVSFRKTWKLGIHELQEVFTKNKKRYEPTLLKRLNDGEWIIAEDYRGGSIAWGLVDGGDLERLEEINKDLLVPDLEIVLDGERFMTAVEKNHMNEADNDRVIAARGHFMFLARRYGWAVVNANAGMEKGPSESTEAVRAEIINVVRGNEIRQALQGFL